MIFIFTVFFKISLTLKRLEESTWHATSWQERVKPWFLVTFNIAICYIFPEDFFETQQVVQIIWKFFWSRLATFANFLDYLAFTWHVTKKLMTLTYNRWCQQFLSFNVSGYISIGLVLLEILRGLGRPLDTSSLPPAEKTTFKKPSFIRVKKTPELSANVPFLYLLKTSAKQRFFWSFQGALAQNRSFGWTYSQLIFLYFSSEQSVPKLINLEICK